MLTRPADRLILHNARNGDGLTGLEIRYQSPATLAPHQRYDLPQVLSYTLRAPLQSADGDAIPDQLQELAPLWARLVSNQVEQGQRAASSLDTDSGHAALVYSWILAANLLRSSASQSAALVDRLRESALRGSSFALSSVSELRNQNDWLPTYANGHDYGFHLAIFDWAYRQTCDVRYRDAMLSLADDLARPEARGVCRSAILKTRATAATFRRNKLGRAARRRWAIRAFDSGPCASPMNERERRSTVARQRCSWTTGCDSTRQFTRSRARCS